MLPYRPKRVRKMQANFFHVDRLTNNRKSNKLIDI